MKKQGKSLLAMMAAMIVVLTTIFAPSSVAATEKVDTLRSGSASLVLELPAASDSVKLYQIAEYDGDSKIVMKKEASDLKVTIDGKESEAALSQKAQTLAGKLQTAAATGKTDAKLTVKFDKLKLGYYLIVVDKCESDSKIIEVAPVIISVPSAQKSSWKYDVTVRLKGQEVKATPVPATTTPKAPTSPGKDETVGADDDSSADSEITPPSPSPSPIPTETETTELITPVTVTPGVTGEPAESGTPTPDVTGEPAESGTPTPVVTGEPAESGTPTPVVTGEPAESGTPTPVVTGEPTESGTPTPSVTGEPTESGTPTPGVTGEPTESGTPTPGVTEEPTPSVTGEPTESITPTPGTDSDDSNPDFPPDDSSIPDITVTPDPNMWQMSVTKYWIDKNNIALPATDETIPDSLSIQIWKRASEDAKWQKVELVDLTAENKWTYSWMALDDGATWTVTEDVVPIGFTQMTIKQSKNTVKKTLDFKVTNMSNADAKPAPVQLSVVKYWKDKNGNDLDDKEIKVESLPIQIYRRERDTETWKLYKKVELAADTAWEYHWGAADDGASWTVTERDVPEGYVLQTPIRLAHNAANTKMEFRVTNISNTGEDTPPTTPPTGTPPTDTPTPTKKPTNTPRPATISFSVVKKWQTASGGTLSNSQTGVSSLTVDIYRKRQGETRYTKVDSIELLPSNNWTHSWTAPDDGSTWTVTEPRIPSGYTKVGITQTSNSSAHTKLFTITNKKTSGSGATPTTRSVTRKVTATATPKVTGSSRTLPNTGDNQNVWIPLITMFGAAVVLVVLIRKRTR